MKSDELKETPRTMTVREAGRKGGSTTALRYGDAHYQQIGKKGGQRVKELIERARATERAEDE